MRLREFLSASAALAVLMLVTSVGLDAQQTGAVSVTVQASNTMEPLQGAQVRVVGTQIGGLTDSDGQVRLTGVPTGTQQVEARLIGYGTRTSSVTIQGGQAASVAFELTRRAVELEEIVVTGTGTAGIQKKRLGNTIATIDASDLENAPVQSVDEMLAAREPGVQVLPSSGLAGEGSKIRIRGTASVTQSGEPLVYIDGVRFTRSGGSFSGLASAGDFGVGSISPLNQIDPNSIERVEVLKGAAAATLYGTEASNGVIQIFTKSGHSGEATWTFEVNGGFESMPTGRLTPHAGFVCQAGDATAAQRACGNLSTLPLAEQIANIEQRFGVSVEPYEVFEAPVLESAAETGRVANVSGQVSGGSDAVTYFASGRYHFNNGIYGFGEFPDQFRGQEGQRSDDRNEQVNGTLSMNIFPAEKLRIQTRAYYANTEQQAPQTANNIFGVWSSLVFTKPELAQCADSGCDPLNAPNYFGQPAFATVHENAQATNTLNVDHFGGNASITYSASETVSLTGTVGADIVNNANETNYPFGWNVDGFNQTNFVTGQRAAATNSVTTITGELRGTWDFQVNPDVSSSLTVGGQGFFSAATDRGGEGQDFPGPGIRNIEAGTIQLTFEDYQQNLNAGFFVQDQVGLYDFAYVTAGVRGDANSAFGDNFSIVFYPKVSTSLVFSDLPGWDSDLLSTFRLRGALGTSGLQPGDFDQFRTYAPLPGPAGTGFETDNIGNPDLKPEKTTEIEAGFEAGLFQDRVSVELSGWNRQVSDMLVNVQFPPSGGFLNRQVQNIGELTSKGVDLAINWQAMQEDDIALNVFANGAYLQQEVTDLGGAAPQKVGGTYTRPRQFIIQGEAPAVFLGARLQDVPIPLDAGTMGVGAACTAPSEAAALGYFSQPRNPSDFEVLPVNCGSSDVLLSKLGKPWPNWQGAFGFDLTLVDRFQVRSMWEYKTGDFWVQHLSGQFRRSNAGIGRNTPGSARATAVMSDPSSSAQERLDAAREWASNYRSLAPMAGLNGVFPADYLRWRELSLTYTVPQSVANALRMSNLRVIGRVRNLALTVNGDYPGISPELNETGQCVNSDVDCNLNVGQEGWRMPLPRRFTLGLRATF